MTHFYILIKSHAYMIEKKTKFDKKTKIITFTILNKSVIIL